MGRTPPDVRSRPAGNHRAAGSGFRNLTLESTVREPYDRTVLARRYWARRLIDRARGAAVPSYGSLEWAGLPEGDPRRVAAVVVAAESWARSGDELVLDLTRELDVRRLAHKREEDAEYRARAKAWRESAPRWGRSFTERRREQLEAAEPRPGDFKGRGEGA